MNPNGYTAADVKKPRHPKVAAWVQAIKKASRAKSQEALAEMLGVSRSGLAKWFYGDQRPGFEELQKLEALARKLGLAAFAQFDPRQPVESAGMSDPRSTVPSSNNEQGEGYTVKTDEARIVAKMLDALPEELRPLAMTEMITAWRKSDVNPSAPSVDRRPGHARKTS